MKIAKDLTGMKFGLWTVLKRVENIGTNPCWLVQCSCENKTIKERISYKLMHGHTKSCGCEKNNSIKQALQKRKKNNVFEEKEDYYECITDKGVFCFDKEDLDLIITIGRCWYIGAGGYVIVKVKGKSIKLHNYLMTPPDGYIVDHIDGNPSNNCRNNLRICKFVDNAKNKKIPTNNTSGVKGVCWNKKHNKWVVRIGYDNKKRLYLGAFHSFEEAVKVRKEAEVKYFGDFNRILPNK